MQADFLSSVINLLTTMGYIGVIGIMAIESTALPVIIPSELFLISYGAAAYKGEMSVPLLIISAMLGIVIGSFVNYYMSAWLGRAVLYKYGKYAFLPVERIKYWEGFFLKYSKFLIFFGRFVPIPAVKHIITIPAGLSRMDIKSFTFLTTLGGGIFSSIVIWCGYWFGKKTDMLDNYSALMNKFMIFTLCIIFGPAILYKLTKYLRNLYKKNKRLDY